MNTLPFKIPGVLTDFADSEGIARIEGEALVLEFQVKDNVFGVLKSAPQEVAIPFAELAEAVFRKRFFTGVLTLRARRLATLATVPGIKENELQLRCKRRDLATAAEFASRLSMKILEHDLKEMAAATSPALHNSTRSPGSGSSK